MSIATFKLNGLSVTVLITTVRSIINKVTAAVAVYATPTPTMEALIAQTDALDDSYQKALSGDKIKKAQMRLDRTTVMGSMSILQAYIQVTSGGDASKILLVADVKRKRTPAGIKPAPGKVRTFFGYQNGQIRLLYGGVGGRIYYRVQINPTPGADDGWVDYAQITKTRLLLTNLNSGNEYAIRIATVTADGMGEWTDPVIQKAL